jgi:hypothetical protein
MMGAGLDEEAGLASPEQGSACAIAWRVMQCFITAYSSSTFL